KAHGTLMAVVVAILTTIVLGLPVAMVIDRNARGTILAGLAYLYGSGVVFAVMLALSIIGVHWSAVNVTACALVLSAICFFVSRKPHAASLAANQPFAFASPDIATLCMI